jgi:hypothetical protein
MPSSDPFFIVGCGRSGTTLLRLILSGHSRIHILPETWFVEPLVRQLPLTEPLTHAQVQSAIAIVTGHYRWPDFDIAAEEFKTWAMALDAPRLVDLINLVYRHHLEKSGKARFGDKTPPYIQIVPELAVLYPNAKFIHLIRDGRDVAISFVEADFEDRCYDGERFEWLRAIHKGLVYRDLPLASRLLEVRYEDLVLNLESTIRRICNFLDETFEPAMLDRRLNVNMVPERERHIHTKLDRPVSSEAVAAWEKKLSATECFIMEACLRKELTTLGYRLRFGGAQWRPLLVISAFFLNGMAPLLDRAIPYLQRRNYLSKKVYI